MNGFVLMRTRPRPGTSSTEAVPMIPALVSADIPTIFAAAERGCPIVGSVVGCVMPVMFCRGTSCARCGIAVYMMNAPISNPSRNIANELEPDLLSGFAIVITWQVLFYVVVTS